MALRAKAMRMGMRMYVRLCLIAMMLLLLWSYMLCGTEFGFDTLINGNFYIQNV